MQNIIGEDMAKVLDYLKTPNVKLHLYGKEMLDPVENGTRNLS